LALRLLLLSAAVAAVALLAREAPAGSAAPVITEGGTVASDEARSPAPPEALSDLIDTDGDGIPDDEDPTPDHDIELEYIFAVGPAPVPIGDTAGRDMLVIGEVMNLRDHDESVAASLDVTGVPGGCVQTASFGVTETSERCLEREYIELPDGQPFTLPALASMWLCYDVRLECHDPAQEGIYPLELTLCADHLVQQQIGYPPGVMDGDPLAPSCKDMAKVMLVVAPEPGTPTPTPPAVGGMVELLGDRTAPSAANPRSSADSPAWYYAALAGVAAGALALTASAWYARRRWGRR